MLRAEEDPAVEAWCAAVQAKHERERADRMAAASAHGYWLEDNDPAPGPELKAKPRGFVTKDSGERVDFPSGMRRDVATGKPRYDLIPRFMLRRIAELYARGAEKYGDNNWQLANSEEEMLRFQASAFRHFMQWLDGERDEDHGAAVFFNIAAAEHTQEKVEAGKAIERVYREYSF